MLELMTRIVSAMSILACFAIFFWLISQFLRKPEGKTENLRNFHCAHDPVLFNKEIKCEVFYPAISIILTQPIIFLVVLQLHALMMTVVPYQMFDKTIESLPVVGQLVLGLFVLDLALWIRHSFVHKYFWPFHAVHHSAEEITWLTTKRLHPVDDLVMGIIDFAVLFIIGFSAEGMAIAAVVKTLHNMYIHSNIVLDYPKPWKYIFVSPNMHRWHHATEKEAHDKNFCVLFAFIDYLFGTYYVPDNALPKAYGSGHGEMDDIASKNILKELWLPFKMASEPTDSAASASPPRAEIARETP